MSYPVYYPEAGDTLPILFASYDGGTGASLTLSGLAVTDIEIYKDGGATQRASDSGYTLLDTDGIDFDGITGIHGFSIDLSDNTDAGFFAVGPWYHVVVSSVTVDGQTVNFIAAAFRIVSTTRGLAGTALPNAAADAAGGLPISDAGGLDVDTLNSNISAILVDTGTTLQAELDGIQADTEDLQSKIGTPAGASIAADIAATPTLAELQLEVDDVQADIAALENLSVADLLDAAAAVDGYTPRQVLALMVAALAGKLSGAATTEVTIRSIDENHERIVATVDGDGNRSAVTLTTTGIT
jgi:hypothetical protein